MKSLISLFMERLGITKISAIKRIIGIAIVLLLAVAAVIGFLFIFPYASKISIQTELITDNHIQVSEILNGDVLVDKDYFLEISKGQQTFISLNNSTISYYFKKDGISYRYNQQVFYDSNNYYIADRNIKDSVLFVNLKRNTIVIVIYIILIIFFLCFLLSFFSSMQRKREINGNYYVWF